MRKDRLAYFKKRLLEKQRQLADEDGRTALYGKDQEADSRRCRSRATASTASGSSSKRSAWPRARRTRPRLPTPAGAPVLAVTLPSSLRTLVSVGFDLKRLFDRYRASPSGEDDSEATALLARAAE